MENILGKVVVFMLDIRTYTGRKQLSAQERAELGIEGDDVLTVGHKKIVDPKAVAVFGTLKKRAERILSQYGVHFLGGYAVPEDKAQQIANELTSIKQEYETEKKYFLDKFEDNIEDWALAHPKWRSMIKGGRHDPDYLRRALGFKYYSVSVQSAEGVDSNMDSAGSELGGRLFTELAKDAQEIYEKSLKGRSVITRKTLRPFYRLQEKVEGLQFVHPDACKVADYMASIMDQLPKEGPLGETETATLAGMTLILAQGDGQVPDAAPVPVAVEEVKPEPVVEATKPTATVSKLDSHKKAEEAPEPKEDDIQEEDQLDMAAGWF